MQLRGLLRLVLKRWRGFRSGVWLRFWLWGEGAAEERSRAWRRHPRRLVGEMVKRLEHIRDLVYEGCFACALRCVRSPVGLSYVVQHHAHASASSGFGRGDATDSAGIEWASGGASGRGAWGWGGGDARAHDSESSGRMGCGCSDSIDVSGWGDGDSEGNGAGDGGGYGDEYPDIFTFPSGWISPCGFGHGAGEPQMQWETQ